MKIKYKSPLGYPGGKTKMAPLIAKHFPDISVFSGITKFHEPFLGGGSISLFVGQVYPHLDIYANDLYTNLYTFWKVLQEDGEHLQNSISFLKEHFKNEEDLKHLFKSCKEVLKEGVENDDEFSIALAFYIVNRMSFSGLTEAGSFSADRSQRNFTLPSIRKLYVYQNLIKNWKLSNKSYEYLSTDSEDTFIYYDPPYEIDSNLYGGSKGDLHNTFSHESFFDEVNKLKSKVMISYNADDCIRERYKDWRQVEFDFTYVMRSNSDKYMEDQQSRKEIILMNY